MPESLSSLISRPTIMEISFWRFISPVGEVPISFPSRSTVMRSAM